MEKTPVMAMLAAVPMPMIIIDRDERICAANMAGNELLGEGVIGRHYAIVLRQPALLELVEQVLLGGKGGKADYQIITPTNRLIYAVTVTPIGYDLVVACAFEDVIAKAQADDFRRDFIANASHELRTPLTTLNGIIETLQGPAKDDPAAQERFLARMQDEVQRMTRLVSDFLSLSRAEAEERRKPVSLVDVTALVRMAVETLSPMAEAAGVTLQLTASDGLPLIPADADQLAQVFQNLIENAIKYDRSGKDVTVAIQKAAPTDGDPAMLQMDVIDQGEGVPPEYLSRLTERFYRVEQSRSQAEGGTGLGLAIVKHIVNRHRGRLSISSSVGKGMRVTVQLPCE